jgi:hypothetical protein
MFHLTCKLSSFVSGLQQLYTERAASLAHDKSRKLPSISHYYMKERTAEAHAALEK